MKKIIKDSLCTVVRINKHLANVQNRIAAAGLELGSGLIKDEELQALMCLLALNIKGQDHYNDEFYGHIEAAIQDRNARKELVQNLKGVFAKIFEESTAKTNQFFASRRYKVAA
jgi:hypothetical protein